MQLIFKCESSRFGDYWRLFESILIIIFSPTEETEGTGESHSS